MQKRIGRLVHDEEWRTLSLPKGLTKAGSWFQTEVLDEDTDIQPWMIENSDDHYEIDVSRARRLLGWQPRHSLAETLPEMIRRLKADPTDWYEKNKLHPAAVAASGPELAQARRRIAGPLERNEAEVEAASKQHRYWTLWAPLTNAVLGLWLISSPMILGLFDPVSVAPPPALGHEIAEATIRNMRLGVSEIVSGLLVAVFALLGMYRRWNWMQWVTAAVGVWIMLAPLVFWTTSAAAYGIDTLIGMLIVAFAVMIPPTPGISRRALAADDDRPMGWSYSPSSFTQRIPIVALAFVGLFVSRYLAAYQMGHIDGLWDPFFGPGGAPVANGSEAVVTSWVSKGFPIADAGFGAFAYALDILAGAIGDRRRWRTMPWMVFLFGLLIIPLGVTSVFFIIIQPPLIGALCTLCIVQAAVTMVLIPYSIDEVLATCPVPMARQEGGRAVLAHLLERRTGAVGEPDARAGSRPSGGKPAARLPHRRRQLPMDAGGERGSRHSALGDAARLRHRAAALLQRPYRRLPGDHGGGHGHGRGGAARSLPQCANWSRHRGITVPIRGRHTDWDGGSSDHWPCADRSELASRDPQRRALRRLGSRNRLT